MATGKFVNDTLNSLLSDSLAEMGIDKDKPKPMGQMKKSSPSNRSQPRHNKDIDTGGVNIPGGRHTYTDSVPYGSFKSDPVSSPGAEGFDEFVGMFGGGSSSLDKQKPLSGSFDIDARPVNLLDPLDADDVFVQPTVTSEGVTSPESSGLDEFVGVFSHNSSQNNINMSDPLTDMGIPMTPFGQEELDIQASEIMETPTVIPAEKDNLSNLLDLTEPTPIEDNAHAGLSADFDQLDILSGHDVDSSRDSFDKQIDPASSESHSVANDDLLGIFSNESQTQKSEDFTSLDDLDEKDTVSEKEVPDSANDDLLGMFSSDPQTSVSEDTSAKGQTEAADEFTSLDDLMAFSTGKKPSEVKTNVGKAESEVECVDELFGTVTRNVSNVSASQNNPVVSTLAEEGEADEPEIRKMLREKRIATVQARMAQKLEEARERETIEALEKAERQEYAMYIRPKLDEWAKGKSENVRALLSTLQLAIWEGSGWKEVSMMDLMSPAAVRKAYRKAMIIMHPDKVKQRGGTTEQIYIADYLFDVTNSAWDHFQRTEM